MKILIFRETELKELNPLILEQKGLAGTESSVVCLAQELSKKHIIKVIAPQIKQQYFDKVEYIPFQSYIEVIIHIKIFNPDILIISGNPTILIEYKFDCKTIFWQQNHPNELDFRFPIESLLKTSLIVAPSPEAATYYNKHYNTNKIVGIYNGVRNEFFNCTWCPEKNKILYIGSFSRTKGLSLVLKTAQELTKYNFYCCGSFNLYGYTDKQYKKYCETLLENSKNVFFLGSLNAKKLAKELCTASVCIANPLPENLETCCVSALEAIVVGTPLICGKSEILSNIVSKNFSITTTNLTQTIKSYFNKTYSYYHNKNFVKNLNWTSIGYEWESLLNKLF